MKITLKTSGMLSGSPERPMLWLPFSINQPKKGLTKFPLRRLKPKSRPSGLAGKNENCFGYEDIVWIQGCPSSSGIQLQQRRFGDNARFYQILWSGCIRCPLKQPSTRYRWCTIPGGGYCRECMCFGHRQYRPFSHLFEARRAHLFPKWICEILSDYGMIMWVLFSFRKGLRNPATKTTRKPGDDSGLFSILPQTCSVLRAPTTGVITFFTAQWEMAVTAGRPWLYPAFYKKIIIISGYDDPGVLSNPFLYGIKIAASLEAIRS